MKILFLDCETIPQENPSKMMDSIPSLFARRFERQMAEDPLTDAKDFYSKQASLHAEFGKLCCVSIGILTATKFQVKAIASRHEKDILNKLADAIDKSQCNLLCGHNSIEFDFPFLMRRYLINGLPVPSILNPDGRKPWETPFIDTMKMWSGSAWNYKVSLDLLANCLGVLSPKSEMDGSKVADVYYGSFNVDDGELPFDKEEQAMNAIGKYCNGDVVTTYKVYCRLKGIESLSDENIVFA